MYKDNYFPDYLVKMIERILRHLCAQIENMPHKEFKALCILMQASVEEINNLQEEFEDAGSDLETGARESIGEDFDFILKTYGFDLDADQYEETIKNRE